MNRRDALRALGAAALPTTVGSTAPTTPTAVTWPPPHLPTWRPPARIWASGSHVLKPPYVTLDGEPVKGCFYADERLGFLRMLLLTPEQVAFAHQHGATEVANDLEGDLFVDDVGLREGERGLYPSSVAKATLYGAVRLWLKTDPDEFVPA